MKVLAESDLYFEISTKFKPEPNHLYFSVLHYQIVNTKIINDYITNRKQQIGF